MALTDWNWLLPADLQDYPWDCSACSTAWAMRTIGFEVSEQDVIAGLGPTRISPALGLLDASGAGLVSYLAEQGIDAANDGDATWSDAWAAAGSQPMVMGGREWGHWVAVRVRRQVQASYGVWELALMNPSPGYRGVYQVISDQQFEALGPFSAVWFNAW